MIGAVVFLLDAAALALALWFTAFASVSGAFDPWGWAGLATAIALVVSGILGCLGGYRLKRLRRFFPGMALLFPSAVAAAIAAGLDLLAALLCCLAFLAPARALGAALTAAALDFGLTERRAILVGGGDRAASVLTSLTEANADIRICAIFDDRDDLRSPLLVRGVPKLGTTADLVGFVRGAEIDMLIVTLPLSADCRIRAVLDAVAVLPVDVRLSDFSDDPCFERRSASQHADGLISVMSLPLRTGQRLAKRALDLVGAAVAIMLLSPLLLLTAAAIRIDSSGPVLFRQPRHGYNHRRSRSGSSVRCGRRIATPPRVAW